MSSFFNENKKNHLWLSIQYMVVVVISLITLKLNLINFGTELFGYWILVASLWGFGRVLDFGLSTSLVKFVAEFNKKDDSQLKYLLSSCLFLMIFLGLVIFIIVYVVGQLFYFNSTEIIRVKYYQNVWDVFLILGASFYVNYLTNFVKSIFEGMSNFVLPSILNIIYSIFILLSVLVSYLLDLQIVYLALFYLCSSLVYLTLFVVSYKIKYRSIEISLKYVNFLMVKRVFSFSLAIQGATIFGSLIDPIVKYLISSQTTIGAVSVYEIARRFVSAITGLFNTTFRTILPKASTLTTLQDYKNFIYKESLNLSRLGIIYSGTIFGIGAFLIPQVILFFFGFREAVLVFLILAIPESINNFGFSIYNFLIGIGKANLVVLIQLINVTIITISVFLGLKIFDNILGLFGYGLTVTWVNILMLLFVRKISGISIKKYFNLTSIYKLIVLIGFILTAIIILSYGKIETLYITLSLGLLSIPIFFTDLKIIINYIYSSFIPRQNV